jgi:hypothetical protein
VLDHRGGGSYYVSNAGSANVSGYTVNGKGVPRLVGIAAATGAGTTDSAAAGGTCTWRTPAAASLRWAPSAVS